MTRLRRELAAPLPRWVLTGLTLVGVAAGTYGPALVVGLAAAACWTAHHRTRRPRKARRR